MNLAVVSDTHGHLPNARQAAHLLESLDVSAVIHCGDIGSVEIVPIFARWPTHYVFGNVDYDEQTLAKAIEAAGQTCHQRFGELELCGKKVAFLHSDDGQLFEQTIHGGQYDLVCYGHTHIAKEEQIGRTIVLNPGALYRARTHTLALVELPSLRVTSFVV